MKAHHGVRSADTGRKSGGMLIIVIFSVVDKKYKMSSLIEKYLINLIFDKKCFLIRQRKKKLYFLHPITKNKKHITVLN